jgi:hypothetical protein
VGPNRRGPGLGLGGGAPRLQKAGREGGGLHAGLGRAAGSPRPVGTGRRGSGDGLSVRDRGPVAGGGIVAYRLGPANCGPRPFVYSSAAQCSSCGL